MMLCAAVVPTASDDSEAASNDWTGTWKCTVTINGTSIVTKYSHNGGTLQDMTAVKGFDDGDVKKTDGSWGFGDEFGPFGSYYAAVDVSTGKIAWHLDPSDLSKTTDGETIDAAKYNIMWVLPTVWMKVTDIVEDDNKVKIGSTLVMSNRKETEDMTAPAHTIDGEVYNYLAIGVYEAYASDGKLYSVSGKDPTVSTPMPSLMECANKNTVADGGHALAWNFYQWQLYRFCSLAVMENFDSQTQIGYGNEIWPYSTGTTISSGPYYGVKTNYRFAGVKLFIENAWGNVWDGVGDTYFSNGLYAGQHSDQVYGSSLVSSAYKTTLNEMYGYGTAPYSTNLDTWGLPTTAVSSWSAVAPDSIHSSRSYNECVLIVGGCRQERDEAGLNAIQGWNNWEHDACGTRMAMVFQADTVTSVKYDHSDLKELLKEYDYPTSLMSNLPTKPTSGSYDQLEDVADFRHVGWIVDGKQYPATSDFVKTSSHTAKSVWVGLPAVTYDHNELKVKSGDRYSVEGLNNGIQIKDHDRYEQLPSRYGFAHTGWRIVIEGQKDVEVGPTDKFVTRQSHTAISLWSDIPRVTFDHSQLTDLVGTTAEGVSDLTNSMVIDGNPKYPQLPDTAGYRHIGWRIGEQEVEPTGDLVSQKTHNAESLWEEIAVVPVIPDGMDSDDYGAIIPPIIEEEHGFWLQKNGKSLLIIAIIAAIIAELAVLCISRKR